MRLHYYTSSTPHQFYFGVNQHYSGQGFGSIFARIFSKVAAKAAAKTALTAAKVAGKKVLKVAARQGTQFAKKAAKRGIQEATKLGAELATQGINTLAEAAINKGAPAEVVHNIQDVVRGGAHTVVDRVGSLANKGVDKLVSRLDTRLQSEPLPLPASSPSKVALPAKASTPRKVSGSKIQNNRRRQRAKRKQLSNSYSTKAKVARINNNLDEL